MQPISITMMRHACHRRQDRMKRRATTMFEGDSATKKPTNGIATWMVQPLAVVGLIGLGSHVLNTWSLPRDVAELKKEVKDQGTEMKKSVSEMDKKLTLLGLIQAAYMGGALVRNGIRKVLRFH